MNTTEKINHIIKSVADYSGLSISNLKGHSRRRNFVKYRYMAMYLCRLYVKATYEEIGLSFNGRDKSTVHHACMSTSYINTNEFQEIFNLLDPEIFKK